MSVVGIVGAGVIGLSWARLFAENGWQVLISDPRSDLQQIIDEQLSDLPVQATADLADLGDAEFVQESGPERLDVKHELFSNLVENTGDDVVLASSSSSLLPSAIAEPTSGGERIVIGHPFNPPELMPLVEVVPGSKTSSKTIDRAVQVYRSLGKLPITLKKEIPGFVGNRLQRVFNDQAMYLVQQGVLAPKDLDDLVKASLGLRWATVGPFEGQHLGGGPDGMRHLVEGIGSQMNFDIGHADPGRVDEVIGQVEKAYGTGADNYARRAHHRDDLTRKVLAALDSGNDGQS